MGLSKKLEAKILSLNIGGPAEMKWGEKSLFSSMLKHPVPGPLVVRVDGIEGNSFSNPAAHGHADSILYIYGMKSAREFASALGLKDYIPGSTGETITVDDLDEKLISVGDKFEIGEVLAQATIPRIPCHKVNYRMQNENGQKAMQECGRSGVYFRILREGRIFAHDVVRLVEPAKWRFTEFDLYRKMVRGEGLSQDEMELALANGAFPEKNLQKWREKLGRA